MPQLMLINPRARRKASKRRARPAKAAAPKKARRYRRNPAAALARIHPAMVSDRIVRLIAFITVPFMNGSDDAARWALSQARNVGRSCRLPIFVRPSLTPRLPRR